MGEAITGDKRITLTWLGVPGVQRHKGTGVVPVPLPYKHALLLCHLSWKAIFEPSAWVSRADMARWLYQESSNKENSLAACLSALAKSCPGAVLVSGGQVRLDLEVCGCDLQDWRTALQTPIPDRWSRSVPELFARRAEKRDGEIPRAATDWLEQRRQSLKLEHLGLAYRLFHQQFLAEGLPACARFLESLADGVDRIPSSGLPGAEGRNVERERVVLQIMLGLGALERGDAARQVGSAHQRWRTAHQLSASSDAFEEVDAWLKAGMSEHCQQALEREWDAQAQHSPFVGREREAARLRGILELERGQTRITWLRGSPGIGKSRLAEEWRKGIGPGAGIVLTGTCLGDGLPLVPLERGVRAVLRQEVLEHLPVEWSSSLARYLPDLLSAHLPPASPALERKYLFSALGALLEAPGKPLFWVIDDVQWADPLTLEFLQHLLHTPPAAGCVLLLTQRDNAPESLAHQQLYEQVTRLHRGNTLLLTALGLEQVHLLMSQMGVASHKAPDAHAASGGNPFLLIEWIRTQRGRGAAMNAPAPGQGRHILAGRFAPLIPPQRALLEALSLLDTPPAPALLRTVLGQSHEDYTEVLDSLEREDMIRLDNRQVRFNHGLFQQFVRDQVSSARAALLHLRAARALIAHPAEAAPHFWACRNDLEEADQARADQTWAACAAEYGLRGDLDIALSWLERRAEFSPDAAGRVQVHLARAQLLERYGRYREALEALNAAERLARQLTDRELRARTQVTRAWLLQAHLGDQAQALKLATQALSSLEPLRSDSALDAQADALSILGWGAYVQGKHDDALAHYERASLLRQDLPDRSKFAGITGAIGLIYAAQGDARALTHLRECLDLREQIGDLNGVGRAWSNLGSYYALLERLNEAQSAFESALKVQQQLGNQTEEAYLHNNLGVLHFQRKKLRPALKAYENALALLEKQGEAVSLDLLFNLGEVLTALNQPQRAQRYLLQALEGLREGEEAELRQSILALLGGSSKPLHPA